MFTGRLSHRDQLTGLFKVTEFRTEFRLSQAVCGEEEFQNAGHSHIQNRANGDFMWDTWGSSLPPSAVACFPELNRRGFSQSLALLMAMGTSMSDTERDGNMGEWTLKLLLV